MVLDAAGLVSILAFFSAYPSLAAQQTPISGSDRPEVRGVVLEPGTNQPVIGAEASLYFLGETRPTIRVGLGHLSALDTTQTDATGAFTFHPEKLGFYSVGVKKDGYSKPRRGEGVDSKDITLTEARPSGEVHLALSRPGQLSGTVVDATTGLPIPKFSLMVAAVQTLSGFRSAMGPIVTTNVEGEFTASNLTAGEFVVITVPQSERKTLVRTKFAEGDLKSIKEDYEQSYWPGGHGLDTALPVVITSGVSVNIGKVQARKIQYFSVHVHIPAGSCGAGDTMVVFTQAYRVVAPFADDVPCSSELLVSGIPPGSDRLVLTTNKRTAATRETASVPFVIKDENLELTAPMERGVSIDATFVAADRARAPDFTRLGLTLYPIDALPMVDIISVRKADAAGRIKYVGVPRVSQKILIAGLEAGYYVKEIRYNGIAIADMVLPLENESMGRNLTIVIDDKPAAIIGTVMEGNKPVSEPYVIAAKWPLPDGNSPYQPARASGDANGSFRFLGLAPGEYRVLALRSQEEDDDRAPGTLERALEIAKKVEVGPSAIQNVTIEPSRLR
jgi:hypothetical protein